MAAYTVDQKSPELQLSPRGSEIMTLGEIDFRHAFHNVVETRLLHYLHGAENDPALVLEEFEKVRYSEIIIWRSLTRSPVKIRFRQGGSLLPLFNIRQESGIKLFSSFSPEWMAPKLSSFVVSILFHDRFRDQTLQLTLFTVPWKVPDSIGNSIVDSQMTMTGHDLRTFIFDPLLSKLVLRLPASSDGNVHILLTGILSECPYVSKFIEKHLSDTHLNTKVKLLKSINGYDIA
jgi:hypothetical protein